MEARERTEGADRLKIKYDYMMKSLGGNGKEEENKSEEGTDKASDSDLDRVYRLVVLCTHGSILGCVLV